MSTQEIQTAERLVRLEQQHAELVRLMQESRADMLDMKTQVTQMNTSLTRWKGIGAGIVITVSILWAGVGAVYALITGHR